MGKRVYGGISHLGRNLFRIWDPYFAEKLKYMEGLGSDPSRIRLHDAGHEGRAGHEGQAGQV